MNLASPQWLWLLAVLPILYVIQRRRRRCDAVRYSSLQGFSGIRKTWRQRLLIVPDLCLYGSLSLLILCLARPQVERVGTREDREGIAIQLLIDVSSSMEMDIKTPKGEDSRMEVAKVVLEQFVAGDGKGLGGRPDDRIGLISFARYSDSICPLTLGHDALVYMIQELTINERPNEDGTAYGDATALAAAQLKAQDEEEGALRSKVILLLTDGENNCGEHMPLQAAAMAKEWGIRIYTISLQSNRPARLVNSKDGKFYRPQTRSEADQVLEKMALATGGVYRTASDYDSLQAVYKEINELEKSKLKVVEFKDFEEGFSPFALAALGLLSLGQLLTATLLRSAP